MSKPGSPISEKVEELSGLGDEALAHLLAHGSEGQRNKVAAIIFDNNRKRVEGYIGHRCRRREDATVIFENVWQVYLNKVFDFTWQGTPFIGWILSITNIQIKAYYDRTPLILSLQELEEQKYGQGLLNQALQSITSYIDGEGEGLTLSPTTKKIQEEADRLIQTLLDELMSSTLSEQERQIIELRYYGEFSFKEIAKRLNMRSGTVRVKHMRALKKLRKSPKLQDIKEAVIVKQS